MSYPTWVNIKGKTRSFRRASIVLENLSPANCVARALEVFGDIGDVLGQDIEGACRGAKGIGGIFWEIEGSKWERG